MNLKEAIESRVSVRHYSDEPVKMEDLKEMVRLAGLAPSVNNTQPWKFIAVTNKELLGAMAERVHAKLGQLKAACNDPEALKAIEKVDWFSTFFSSAPAVIAVVCSPYQAVVDQVLPVAGLDHDQINQQRGCPDIQSIGASIQNILLAAVDMGYGACWLSGPLVAREELEALLGVSAPNRLAAMISVGHPAGQISRREKKSVEEIFEAIQ